MCAAMVAAFAQKTENHNKDLNSMKMKEFSFIVRVPLTYSREQVQQAGAIWNSLIEKWKSDGIYITSFPFPGEGYLVSGKNRETTKESVVSNNTRVVSNIFLKAEDFEKAIALAKTFPILDYEGTVEVREIPPRPATTN